ncbi:Pirin [hydrothermal vent metagenome]|uniref:Pirin n=1 Tax=hydrothermal vent metagenome TaxID=652676 RepID=A0A3B0Z3T6_9ZZZZ
MIKIRHNEERGSAKHGWLQSKHSFSFADYYDPDYMGVSSLRVINDDIVAPGKGFDTHSHQDMEIISYVKRGVIEHKDSMGNIETLPAGEFQLMTAGTGVTHSEYNPSPTDVLEFLQIWVEPNVLGIEPSYQQKRFEMVSGLQLIASADARQGSLLIHQDVNVYQLMLDANSSIEVECQADRTIYMHMVAGALEIDGQLLAEGDGATFKQTALVVLNASTTVEALLFDLKDDLL